MKSEEMIKFPQVKVKLKLVTTMTTMLKVNSTNSLC